MELLRDLLDLLAPSSCDGCGRRAAPPWCAACAAAAPPPRPACVRCGGATRLGHGCWPVDAGVECTVVLHGWTGPVATAIARAKDVGRTEVLLAAGEQLAAAVRAAGVEAPGLVVPVATDRRRARRRGADHALAIARGTARGLGVPVARLVRPVGAMSDHGRVTPDERAALPAPRLVVVRPPPPHVLVVDDVLTTGATLRAVVDVLRAAGAARVDVGVLARAGQRHLTGA
jgi:predicted amidophosphoribosyltransferase